MRNSVLGPEDTAVSTAIIPDLTLLLYLRDTNEKQDKDVKYKQYYVYINAKEKCMLGLGREKSVKN